MSEKHKNPGDTIFPSNKKFINYTSRATLWQKNTFLVEVTFNVKSSK